MGLQEWILQQDSVASVMLPWQKCSGVNSVPAVWSKGSASKLLGASLAENTIPEQCTVIGGICSIFSAESEAIRSGQIAFKTVHDFETWLKSWYPRLDQIHDTVGIPPKNTQRIVYVCEDSLFAHRIAVQTGLDTVELMALLRTVHEQQGHRVLLNWIRQNGYNGPVEVVYTSDLTKEITAALRIWQRLGNFKIPNKDIDMATVKLMYTWLWADILGVKKAVIYEPANHMFLEEPLDYLRHWFKTQSSKDIGFIGYLPFWNAAGQSRKLEYGQVPNWSNWREFQIPRGEAAWYAVNTLFGQKSVIRSGPEIPTQEVQKQLSFDLQTYYGGV